ncbi:MAG TPA: SDR family oxidoreductase [Actinomadura sp.]|jgi:NADP-dependent 3-hydroxy acid dehydrogenase YdfG|nr:SDR family oxidoreductase [Actinomadura sp.]
MTDRVFLITGASSGIGEATARLAVEEGHRVVLAGRRRELLDRLAGELGGPGRAIPVMCDVTEWDQVRSAVDRARKAYGRLDVVFANAGVANRSSFLEGGSTPEDWRSMVLTNVYGPAITARAAMPALLESKGHFVLTGSIAGRIPTPGSLYSATKWAMTGLAQNLRAELADSGVRVTLIQPGLTDTVLINPDRAGDVKLDPADVARTVMFAVNQPPSVDINEIVVRPTGQAWHR